MSSRNRASWERRSPAWQQAARLKPDYAEAHNNLGGTLREQGKFEEAAASLQQALRLEPDFAEAHTNLGNVLREQGKLEEAAASLQKALRLKPDFAEAHNNLGIVLQEQGKLEEAAASLQKALRLKPDFAEAHSNLGMLWLLQGDFERGWPKFEWRWRKKEFAFPPSPVPPGTARRCRARPFFCLRSRAWGTPSSAFVMQPLVQQRGLPVPVRSAHPPCRGLLEGVAGVDRLLVHGEAVPAFDVQAGLLSLPGLVETRLDTIPATGSLPGGQTGPGRTLARGLQPLGGFKVGIVWQGNPKHKGDRRRSIPLERFEALARLEGVRLVSLQKGLGRRTVGPRAAAFPSSTSDNGWRRSATPRRC